jgi:hypothetical protein
MSKKQMSNIAEMKSMTNRNNTPGNKPDGYIQMMEDTFAPPQVGPFVWAAFGLLLYLYRGDEYTSYVVCAMAMVVYFLYVECKRHQSNHQHEEIGGLRTDGILPAVSYIRYLLYVVEVAHLVAVAPAMNASGLGWAAIAIQLILFGMFYLEHAHHISNVRRFYCEQDTTGASAEACRLPL